MNVRLVCLVLCSLGITHINLHPVASVQKELLKQLLAHAVSQSISLTASDIETSLSEASAQRETVDNEQHILVYYLLNHAQNNSLTLTDSGLGAALTNGSLSVQQEVTDFIINHAKNNSITLLASDIESALQEAAKDWVPLTDEEQADPTRQDELKDWQALSADQLTVIYNLLQYAVDHSLTLSANGLELALKEACISLKKDVVKLILQHAEQTSVLLTASGLEAALAELVKDRNEVQSLQSEILYDILTYASNNSIALSANGLGNIVTESVKKYISS